MINFKSFFFSILCSVLSFSCHALISLHHTNFGIVFPLLLGSEYFLISLRFVLWPMYSVPPCRFLSFCVMCSNALVRHRHIKNYCVILAGWCLYHYVLPFFIPGNFSWCEVCSVWTNTAPPAIFWLVLEWYLFLHPFTFHLYMSLYLK